MSPIISNNSSQPIVPAGPPDSEPPVASFARIRNPQTHCLPTQFHDSEEVQDKKDGEFIDINQISDKVEVEMKLFMVIPMSNVPASLLLTLSQLHKQFQILLCLAWVGTNIDSIELEICSKGLPKKFQVSRQTLEAQGILRSIHLLVG